LNRALKSATFEEAKLLESHQMSKEQYPIGPFKKPSSYTEADLRNWMSDLQKLPALLEAEVKGLDDDDLETPYRDGGWTIRQVINHIADSHVNMYLRIRQALTQNNPSIIAYDQDSWAMLIDAEDGPIEPSIKIIDGIHSRTLYLLDSLRHGEFERTYYHPEYDKTYKIWEVVALYAWHSNHHLAHVKMAKKKI